MKLNRRNIYVLLVTIFPAHVRGWLHVVPSLYESRMLPWARECLLDLMVARHGGYESYTAKDPLLSWVRGEMSYPTRYVYAVKNAFVSLPRGRVKAAGYWLGESFGNPLNAPCEILFLKLFGWISKIRGRTAHLPVNDGGYVYCRCDGYYHFIAESLVSLLYALKLRPNASVVVQRTDYDRTAYFRQYIELLQRNGRIKKVEIIDADCIVAPELVFASFEPDSGVFCRESAELLRSALLTTDMSDWRRDHKIFLTRKGKRQFENQKELEDTARQIGYEVVDTDGMSVRDQILLFYTASEIVSNHGAGLMNLIYCKSGTKVTELFSPRWLNDCYFRIAYVCGLTYSHLVANGDGQWGRIPFPLK